MSVEVILPAVRRRDTPPPPTAKPAPVWKSLPAKPVIGLIDNTKTRAADLLESIGRNLVRRGFADSYFIIRKQNAAVTSTEADRATLLERADIVISGLGDCGACTSCSVLDALYCSEMGLPSTVVVSSPFQSLARYTCKNMAQPDFSVLVVEHPVWTHDDAWIEAAADKLIEPFLKIVAPSVATKKLELVQ